MLGNDTDANNDALTAVLNTGPTNAQSFTLNPDGSFNYTPNADFTGDDTFTYHANDGSADSNVATVTITVNPANDAPVAVNDSFTVNEDIALTGTSVLANDTDTESDPLTAVLDIGPTNASAFTLNPDGTFSYTPNANFFGTDTFTYHANDGNSDSNVATVTITVDPVNDAPSFVAGGAVTVLEDAGAVIVPWATGISAGPADESGQTLTFLVSNNNNGLFSAQPAVSPSGVLTFTPASNAFGSATVMVTLQDNGGTVSGGVDSLGPLSFSITVTAVNDAPVATVKSHQTHSGIRVTIGAAHSGKLKDGATDVDDPLGDLAVNSMFGSITPAGTTIALTDAATGTFTYNPPAGFSGPASFQYQICDDGIPTPPVMCSAPATVSFNVTGSDLWFVDDSAGAGGTGRFTDPFDALSDLPAGRGTGDRIFVFSGTYGGHTLLTNEHLIGQGSSGSFDTALGVSVPVNGTLDSRPALGGARPQSNGTVVLGGSSTVRGLNIASGAATGLSGGAVTGVNISEVSVTSTTGTAVNLIGTGGTVGLTAVSANGAANGMLLQNTTGSFTVDGDGANTSLGGNGSGGTISNASGGDGAVAGSAVYLDNVQNVTLRRMTINGSNGNFGIRGFSVNGFALEHATVGGTNGTNGTIASYGEGSVYFGTAFGATGLTGSGTVNNCNISGGRARNFSVVNTSGTLNRLTITGTTFGKNQEFNNGTTFADDNLAVEARNSGTVAHVTVQGSTFTGSPGDLVDFTGQTGTTMDVIFGGAGAGQNNTLSNNHLDNIIGGGGMTLATQGIMTFNMSNNSFRGANGSAITLQKATAGTSLSGTVNNNTIGATGVAGSGSATANGLFFSFAGGGTITLAITDNEILRYNGNAGIFADNTGGTYDLNLTLTGNRTAEPGGGAFAGLALTAGAPASADDIDVCAQIGGAGSLGNDFSTGDPANSNDAILGVSTAASSMRLPGYAGTTLANVQNFVLGNNNVAGTVVSAFVDAPATAANYIGGAACPTPP